ncbi:hypothetical protein STTU_4093 [Streptomyces sp. Tu6071]|nr:hypothetical protein STTU_4093 [Streptomyces sp. Tu6071]
MRVTLSLQAGTESSPERWTPSDICPSAYRVNRHSPLNDGHPKELRPDCRPRHST